MGQAGMLDTARFTHFVAEELGVPVKSVSTLTLGSHGDTMVPVPSACAVDGKPLSDLCPRTRSKSWSIELATAELRLSPCSRLDQPTSPHPLRRRAWREP